MIIKNNLKNKLNTTQEFNTYLLELINTDRNEFVKFDMQKIIKSAKAKLEREE